MKSRINATWLRFSYPSQIIKNRLKRYPKDRINYYSIDFPKYFFLEEGD